jgi:peptidoglycan-associated lipoprotein
MKRSHLYYAGILGLFAVLAGCDTPGIKSKVKSPNQIAQQPIGEATTTSANIDANAVKAQAPAVWTPNLTISDVIAKACGITPRGSKAAAAPSFEFDSAALGPEDREMLAEVAKCLTTGALKGKSIGLIGRADARGEDEYNMTLGAHRADAVKRYFVDLGVGKDRLRASSRGELDATGKDEAGYAQDRRVDIELL